MEEMKGSDVPIRTPPTVSCGTTCGQDRMRKNGQKIVGGVDAGSGEIIVDLVAAYRGNAVASGTLHLSPLQIPVTLSKVSVTNIKMRIIFKGVVDKFPMINGVQMFLLEPPKLDWSNDFATKVTNVSMGKIQKVLDILISFSR